MIISEMGFIDAFIFLCIFSNFLQMNICCFYNREEAANRKYGNIVLSYANCHEKLFKKVSFSESWPEKQWFAFHMWLVQTEKSCEVKYKMNFKDLAYKKKTTKKKEYKIPPVFLDIDYMLKW